MIDGPRFYQYEEIKAGINCAQVLDHFGIPHSGGRCAATWRGGKNQNVAFETHSWYDHKSHDKGSVIDLVNHIKFNGQDVGLLQSGRYLGDLLGLPYKTPGPDPTSRYGQLLNKGYKETMRHRYTDEVGNLKHQEVRLDHPDPNLPKQYMQCDAKGRWSIKGIDPVPYNLPSVINAQSVFIVEGGKCADVLNQNGCVATTNAGGTEKWPLNFAQYFKGKDVAILYDNDTQVLNGKNEPVGILHAKKIAASLITVANSVRMLKTSDRPKGDVVDYLNAGNTINDLFTLVQNTEKLTPEQLVGVELPKEHNSEVMIAKDANRFEFRNFTERKETIDNKTKVTKEATQINNLVDDCHKRFLGFPRKVGELMFDHDRNSGEIFYIGKGTTLFSWIARKSKQRINWPRGDSMVSKDELFEALKAEATRYESISKVPDFPVREDVYYSHPPLPMPSDNLEHFNKLVSFFNPVEGFEVLLKTFIAAPLLYRPSIPRPLWIIDSESPGSGKTTLANVIAMLYGGPPIEVKKREFAKDMQKITERLVSRSGRLARMLLVDNVTGTFASEELSGLITMPYISGKAPYGTGEETRPNNLTYVITANNASIDNDLAIRAYFVRLKSLVDYSPTWATEVSCYIEKHRLNIFADIMHLITNHKPFPGVAPVTRCPEFEIQLLQAMCGDMDTYSTTVETMANTRSDSNIEEDWGQQIVDDFRAELADIGIHPDYNTVWIHSGVAEEWFKKSFPNVRENATQLLRNLAKSGHCSRIDGALKIWPHRGKGRRRGILWLDAKGTKKPRATVSKQGRKVNTEVHSALLRDCDVGKI